MYQLRDYQQEAVDATLRHFRQSEAPAVIVLPTGAGKSLVIAELCRLARGHAMCLTHVKELVEQNHQKLTDFGVDAGIFSAGLKQKQRDKRLTIASVQSLVNHLCDWHQPLSLLIIDECHRIGADAESQYHQVIEHFRQLNPTLKVLGLTATPYRLDNGWIYQQHYWGFTREAPQAFFQRCIYELPLRRLVKDGYLTPPVLYNAAVAHYDFSAVTESVVEDEVMLNQLVLKHPRVTRAICEQILTLSETRQGVMIFAATVAHAEEICQYLPSEQTALITGATSPAQRDALIGSFKAKQIKFLVNVSVLTTGFDAPHVDVIALLRPTESVGLFQQIIGRGLRLAPGKQDCLILDYTNSGFDIFQPEIGGNRPKNTELVSVPCPQCDYQNLFWGRKDSDGNLTEHFGRRCQALVETLHGDEQCDYRYVFKHCPQCQAENDIAAHQCHQCQHKLIDPDDTLKKALNLKDHLVLRCQGLASSIEGEKLIIRYVDEDGTELKQSYRLDHKKDVQRLNQEFMRRMAHGAVPVEISNSKDLAPFLPYLPAPDFVIAKKERGHFRVTELIFDYQGNLRKANHL